ncbi:MAG: chalcone isomerase family protein [Pseudomonadota bacterium]
MKSIIHLFLAVFVCLSGSAIAAEKLPETLSVNSVELVKNGQGVRKRLFIALYEAALYLPDKTNDARSIVNADESMAVVLTIVSDLITPEKMEKAIFDGFSKSTGGDLTPIATQIDEFLSAFRSGIAVGDRFDLSYSANEGTVVEKNDEAVVTVAGLPFKQALFGIWLSDKPVQKSLKKALLGNK